jgi:ferredoxin
MFAEDAKARLKAEAASYEGTLQHLTADDLSGAEGSVMVKDETICIRCGLCAERCPAHTITMEAFEAFEENPDKTPLEEILLRP